MPTKLEMNRALAEEKGYIAAAHAAEEQYGIPRGLFVGLLEQESAWRPEVISGKKKSRAGAQGIAQFMPATAADEGIDPLNPDEAIPAGAAYLARMYKSTGSWTGALTAYNWGIGNYNKWLKGERKAQPKEAREYAGKVQKRAKNYRQPKNTELPVQPATAAPVETIPDVVTSTGAGNPTVPKNTLSEVPSAPTMLPTQSSTSTPAPIPSVAQPTSPAPTALIPPPNALPEPTGIGLDRAMIPPPRGLPTRGQRAETFKLKKPKKLQATIATPAGPRQVQAETPEEEQLIQDLSASGETQMLALMPELIQTRDLARSKPLIKTRGDSLDKLLTEIVENAGYA